jgi:UDP-N-acetylmuramate dehydrogenase
MDINKGIDNLYAQLAEKISKNCIMKDVHMREHTSFKIGGPADLMVWPHSREELQYAIQVCKEWNSPYYVIGNGSNLLVRDKGIRGVVIKIAENFSNVRIEGEKVMAQAGILLSILAKKVIEKSLKGFEFASGIPGTLGGAIAMNAGAYGGEMKDVLLGAHVLDHQGEITYLDREALALGYRDSIIQQKGWIVLEAEIQLEEGKEEAIKERIRDFTQRRIAKQPLHLPSAGSTFRRPPGYFAGKLIEEAGLKGVRVGGAQVSEVHAGFIVNVESATATEVIQLIELIQKVVKDKFDVALYPEVKIIGEA